MIIEKRQKEKEHFLRKVKKNRQKKPRRRETRPKKKTRFPKRETQNQSEDGKNPIIERFAKPRSADFLHGLRKKREIKKKFEGEGYPTVNGRKKTGSSWGKVRDPTPNSKGEGRLRERTVNGTLKPDGEQKEGRRIIRPL